MEWIGHSMKTLAQMQAPTFLQESQQRISMEGGV
jgi:hypothetical protein